ncbi:hypothetical protein HYC85_015253 [Camellia sinensis]|uniref:SCP domain-containing protein n=1 Tax=Camellia sinensis TaxID=4442 RepID=A0A7J7GXN3_CAMSI|nr:hypothetical protein HYC85_015253 [Camellia sinensis]
MSYELSLGSSLLCPKLTTRLPQCLQHSSYQVGVGPMTWDNNLATYAQNYANSRMGDCNLIHSGGPYGENLVEGRGSFTGTDRVNL